MKNWSFLLLLIFAFQPAVFAEDEASSVVASAENSAAQKMLLGADDQFDDFILEDEALIEDSDLFLDEDFEGGPEAELKS